MIQNLMDGILTGSIISLGAIGLTMVMHMLRFANFAYAELLAIGAYAALVFDRVFAALVPVMDQSFGGLSLTWTLTLATLAAMAVTGASAVIIDWAIFKRIREKADALSMVFASFGVALIIRNVITLIFGLKAELYSNDIAFAMVLSRDPLLLIKPDQVFVLGAALILMAIFHAFSPAISGSLESPARKNVRLKRFSTLPS